MTSLSLIPSFLAQAAEAPAAQTAAQPSSGAGSMLFFVLLLVGMWFLIIAPQRRRQKEQQKLLSALQAGDKIVTAGGVLGTIRHVEADSYTIQIDDGVQIKILKPFIQGRQPGSAPAAAPAEAKK